MPEPPSASLVTHYVFENPWPLAIILLALAAFNAWTGFREGLVLRQRLAGILAIVAAGAMTLGFVVTTAGEHARLITRSLVDATVNKDLRGTGALLADHATVTFGKPTNPKLDRDFILERLGRFAERFTIDSNSITSLKAYTESSTSGVVHLACWTTLKEMAYPSPSQWVVRVEKQANDQWMISQVTCVSVGNETPNGEF